MRKTRKYKRHTATKQFGGFKKSLLPALVASNVPLLRNVIAPHLKTPLNTYRTFSKRYFNNDSIFLLCGHAGDTESSRYKLKDNEFFASPIECGRITYSSSEPFLEFASHNMKIKIPNVKDETSLHPLMYSDFPLKLKSTISALSVNNEYKREEMDSWKLYFPQSSYKSTNTIPPIEFKYFNGHYVKTNKNDLFHSYVGEPVEFTYKGTTNYIESGDYFIYTVSVSGVLFPNQDVNKFIDKLYKLKEYSDIIQNTFNLPNNMEYYLYILIPVEDYYEDNDYIHSKISYYKYLKDVLIELSELSYIVIDDIINDNLLVSKILDASLLVEDIFKIIREDKGDEPIFIINPLCRSLPSHLKESAQLLENESNLETNVRGLVPYSLRRRRITEKQKKKYISQSNPL